MDIFEFLAFSNYLNKYFLKEGVHTFARNYLSWLAKPITNYLEEFSKFWFNEGITSSNMFGLTKNGIRHPIFFAVLLNVLTIKDAINIKYWFY
jgi:hypothetical protein